MKDTVYLTETPKSDLKLVTRCSICGKRMEFTSKDLVSVKMNKDNKCLLCDKCFDKLYK